MCIRDSVEDATFTLLTAERYASQRQAIGRIHRWLEAHAELYYDGENTVRQNAATVALQHPGDRLWQAWDRLAPLYFGACQTLTAACIPWRVVPAASRQASHDLQGVDVLLTFDDPGSAGDLSPHAPRRICILDLDCWAPPPPSFLARSPRIRGLAGRALGWMFQGYFRWRWARRLVDRLGLVHFFWQTPYFRLPSEPARRALLDAVGPGSTPRVSAPHPVLVELWRRAGRAQLHLVNYAPTPTAVRVDFKAPVAGTILSPDDDTHTPFDAVQVSLELDVYAIPVSYTHLTLPTKRIV